MDLIKIIHELRHEREKLEAIITSLEQLQRPESFPAPAPVSRRGRRSMDAAGRLEVSRRMKQYWEARRNKGESGQPEPHGSHARVDTVSA